MKWEYRIERIGMTIWESNSDATLTEILNKLGKKRWELIHITESNYVRLVFRRRVFTGLHPKGLRDDGRSEI